MGEHVVEGLGLGHHLEEMIANGVRRGVSAALAEYDSRQQERLPPRPVPTLEALDAPYMTKAQVVAYTGYSKRTIERLIAQGVLPVCGPRGDRIRRFAVDRMMAEHARGPRPTADGTGAVTGEDAEAEAEADRLLNDE